MLKGINQWAFPQETPIEDALRQAAEAGFAAFEVCVAESGPLGLDAPDTAWQTIRRAAEKLGLALPSVATALGWQYPLTAPDPEVRAHGQSIVRRLMEIADSLGADTVLVVPGVVDRETRYDEAIERALATLEPLVTEAEQRQVSLALENVWNRFLLSPVEFRDFIDQIDSRCLGAYFDVGNVLLYGLPEQWIRILGARLRKIHVKDYRVAAGTEDGFVLPLEGDVDWPAVMAALRAVNYSGPLTAEYGPAPDDINARLRALSAALDSILGM